MSKPHGHDTHKLVKCASASPPHVIRGGRSWLYLAAAIVCLLAAIPSFPVFVQQLLAMAPYGIDKPERERRNQIVRGAFGPPMMVPIDAMRAVNRQPQAPISFDQARRIDRDNGLYDYLQLLLALRQTPPPGMQHALPPAAFDQLRYVLSAPPVKLHRPALQKRIADALLQSNTVAPEAPQIGPREAAVEGVRTLAFLGDDHKIILRELSDRLLDWGDEYRKSNGPREALLLDLVAARMLTQVVNDSPVYDTVLVAAEKLPRSMTALAADAQALRADEADVAPARAAADAVQQFVTRWRHIDGNETNIVPFSGSIPHHIAIAAQRPLLKSIATVCAASASLAVLLAVGFVLGAATILLPNGRTVPIAWRRGALGEWGGVLILLIPLTALTTVALSPSTSLTWIFTANTGFALVWSGGAFLLALALATRVAARLPDSLESQRTHPARAALVLIATVAALALAAYFAAPAIARADRPPLGVQRLRKLITFIGMASLVVSIAWFAWGRVWSARVKLPAGVLARIQLALIARTLVIGAFFLSLSLYLNVAIDRRHQKAFAAASERIVADALGEDWHDRHFKPAQDAIVRAEALLQSPSTTPATRTQ